MTTETLRQQFIKCGKPKCGTCRGRAATGHGPYWYAFWKEEGRTRSRYIGKELPWSSAAVETRRGPSPRSYVTKAKPVGLHKTGGRAPRREPSSPTRPLVISPLAFATAVRAAAKSSSSGRWGPDKVFISHVFSSFLESHEGWRGGLAAFKARLADAQQAGLVQLSRADLVGAMSAGDVRASETLGYGGAAFHFVHLVRTP